MNKKDYDVELEISLSDKYSNAEYLLNGNSDNVIVSTTLLQYSKEELIDIFEEIKNNIDDNITSIFNDGINYVKGEIEHHIENIECGTKIENVLSEVEKLNETLDGL